VQVLREALTVDGLSMVQGAQAYIWGLDRRMVPIPGFKTIHPCKTTRVFWRQVRLARRKSAKWRRS